MKSIMRAVFAVVLPATEFKSRNADFEFRSIRHSLLASIANDLSRGIDCKESIHWTIACSAEETIENI